MIPDKDYFADKHGKLTDDPTQWAFQIGVKGVNLDERIAKRYGITDSLVSVDEPGAVRRVTGRNEASIKIVKSEEKTEDDKQKPQEPAEAAEPKATSEPEAIATGKDETKAAKPAAKKGEKLK